MNSTPQNNSSSVEPQEADILGVIPPRSTPLSGAEQLLPYLFAAMETCWVDAIMIGLASANTTSFQAFFLPLWVPFLIIASSCWLSNTLARRRANAAPAQATSFPITLLVVWLVFGTTLFSLWSGVYASSTAFFDPTWLGNLVGDVFLLGPQALHIIGIIALILYFYWRGLRLSQSALEPGNVVNVLRIGIGVILAVIVLRATTYTASFNAGLFLLLIPLFLLFALLAHAFAQTVFVRTTHRSGLQGSVFSQERALSGIIVAFGVVLLLLSLLVGAVASPAFLADAQRIFTPIVLLYDTLVNILAFVLTLLIAPILWLLNFFHFRLKDPNIQAQTSQIFCKKYPHSIQCTKNPPPQGSFSPLLVLSIKILLPVLVLVLLILIVRLLMRRRRISVTRRIVEVHESVWSWKLFWTQMRAFLRALWLRLFPRLAGETDVQEKENEVSTEPMARSIREVYRAMLRWAAQRGYPRKKDETPYEFRTRLRTRLPFVEPEISTMTEAYSAIRYGRVVPDEADVTRIQQTWIQLQHKTSNVQQE